MTPPELAEAAVPTGADDIRVSDSRNLMSYGTTLHVENGNGGTWHWPEPRS